MIGCEASSAGFLAANIVEPAAASTRRPRFIAIQLLFNAGL